MFNYLSIENLSEAELLELYDESVENGETSLISNYRCPCICTCSDNSTSRYDCYQSSDMARGTYNSAWATYGKSNCSYYICPSRSGFSSLIITGSCWYAS